MARFWASGPESGGGALRAGSQVTIFGSKGGGEGCLGGGGAAGAGAGAGGWYDGGRVESSGAGAAGWKNVVSVVPNETCFLPLSGVLGRSEGSNLG